MKYLIPALALVATFATIPQTTVFAAAPAAQAASNDELAARVKAQIEGDAEFKDSQIAVTAVGGDVTLNGVASSPVVRLKIVEKVKATEGVTKVNNKVKIAKAKK